MVKSDGLRNCSTRVRTPVALLCSLSGKYPWERYEPPYPPSYGLNYCSSRRMALALNNLKRVDMPLNKETKPKAFRKVLKVVVLLLLLNLDIEQSTSEIPLLTLSCIIIFLNVLHILKYYPWNELLIWEKKEKVTH